MARRVVEFQLKTPVPFGAHRESIDTLPARDAAASLEIEHHDLWVLRLRPQGAAGGPTLTIPLSNVAYLVLED